VGRMSPAHSSHSDTTSSITATKETTANSDSASTSYQPLPEMTPEIYELEATDSGSIGLVLRAIYESGDVTKFSRGLEHRIHQYDKNIQRVCSHHYQGFIDSMKQLMQLREKCEAIKEEAKEIDSTIQTASSEMAAKTTEIVKYRKQMRNAMVAIDHISVCLPVLDNYSKLLELMGQSKYYQALKVLEELEHTHFKLIEQYRFTQDLSKSMDPLREEIKEKAYSEFKDFLENIKKVACRIGVHACKCTAEMHSFGVSEADRVRKLQEEARKNVVSVKVAISADGALINQDSAGNKPAKRVSDFDDSEQLSAQDLIDFTPIHRCSQIFNVLGKKDEFEAYYRKQREQQCDIVCKAPPKMTTLKQYVDWLNEIVGFFVVEDHIHLTEPSLVTAQHTENLWKNASTAVFDLLNSHFGVFSDVEMMIRMKKVVLLFALTMKSYGYDITRLYQLLKHFTDQYTELLMREYEAQFVRDLESDNYTPISVDDEEEFRTIVRQFPFYKRSIEKEDYPRKFPFSRFVIGVYVQVKNYLVNCLKFMENLQMSHSDIEDSMRKFANVLLVRWSEHLKQYIHENRTLIQLVQMTVNMGYMEKSCESLGPFITRIVNGGENPAHATGHLVALSDKVFRDARTEAEQQIEESLRKKVDLFLDNIAYDWELPSSAGHASDYILDLISFLRTTFTSFTNLPNTLAKHVCIQICKYVADSLLMILTSPDFRIVSRGALEQFNLDVMQAEMFTAQAPVTGLDPQTLPVTFATLRQLLDLVVEDDWTTFCAEARNDKKRYDRVKINDAIVILEKKIEWEKKTSGLFSMKGSDRKKLLESVHRQLRIIAAEK
ncbi:sec-15, partial [Pristionchus pacificus]|uniref:Exocyst complex component n=1 Tax=Pristionchus pacificus TaxID=54126 RepID=A0A8R1Z2G3_PRIPA